MSQIQRLLETKRENYQISIKKNDENERGQRIEIIENVNVFEYRPIDLYNLATECKPSGEATLMYMASEGGNKINTLLQCISPLLD